MKTINLTSADRREFRAQAHHLDPVVMIGGEGLTKAVIKETDAALNAHGLIKIRVLGDDRQERIEMSETLCQQLGAALVQHIGKLLVLFRPLPEKEAKVDPERKAGPRVVKVVKPSRSKTHRPTVKKVRVLGNERVTAGGNIKRKRAAPRSKKAPL